MFTLKTAAHVDHRVAIPILHVKYRAQFLLGVGWDGMSYWVYVTLSCHNWKRNDFRCNREFTSASSCGLGWYKYAIAIQWYQFHTTDAWWFSLRNNDMRWMFCYDLMCHLIWQKHYNTRCVFFIHLIAFKIKYDRKLFRPISAIWRVAVTQIIFYISQPLATRAVASRWGCCSKSQISLHYRNPISLGILPRNIELKCCLIHCNRSVHFYADNIFQRHFRERFFSISNEISLIYVLCG